MMTIVGVYLGDFVDEQGVRQVRIGNQLYACVADTRTLYYGAIVRITLDDARRIVAIERHASDDEDAPVSLS